MDQNYFSEITPDILHLASLCEQSDVIDSELFTKYDVKRGLRDLNGKVFWQDSHIFLMFGLRK